MSKKLYISLIFSNLVMFKTLSPNHRMYNLYTKFVKILEICKQFSENLVNESANYGDKGYIGADVQLDLFETAHIRLECPYRLNQKDWKPTFIPFAKARKRIETIFSQLTDLFLVIRNYAKITNVLFPRIIGKISALTILQYVNFINDKPIGRIKYALN
ncbi:transposase [Prevotella pectinovora]|uniref:transposase n=1 Tax=Prevotella pectinovora TaxID=1602169 RepID=UPI0009E2F4B1